MLRSESRHEPAHANLLEIPDDALCPISHQIMRDPVVCADGHSYERASIQHWLATQPPGNHRSPKTNLLLLDTSLVQNHTLRNMIESLLERMPAIQREHVQLLRERESFYEILGVLYEADGETPEPAAPEESADLLVDQQVDVELHEELDVAVKTGGMFVDLVDRMTQIILAIQGHVTRKGFFIMFILMVVVVMNQIKGSEETFCRLLRKVHMGKSSWLYQLGASLGLVRTPEVRFWNLGVLSFGSEGARLYCGSCGLWLQMPQTPILLSLTVLALCCMTSSLRARFLAPS